MQKPNLTPTLELDLKATFEPLSECVLAADINGRIVFINQAAVEAFGYSIEELHGQSGARLYTEPGGSRPLPMEGLVPAGSGVSHNRIMTLWRKNGRPMSCEITHTLLVGSSARPAGYLLIGKDMTDRLALDDMAERASATLEDALEAISEGFALYDRDDKLIICNKNYRKIYPESAKAMIPGTSFREILKFGLENGQYDTGPLTDEEWLDERLAAHQKADGRTLEQPLGDGRWLRISERRTRSNGIAGIRADITEIKKAQEALREAYANITILTDSLSCCIVEVDLDGTCIFINDFGAQWFAAVPSDLIGTKIRKHLGREARGQADPKHQLALAGERVRQELTETFPDGIRRDILLEYIPKKDENGRVTGIISFATDITDRKKVETTLAELYAATSARLLDMPQKIQSILMIGCNHFDLEYGTIGQIADANFTIKWAVCPNDELEAGACLPLDSQYCNHTFTAGEPLAVSQISASDLSQHPCYERSGLEAYIGAPLLVDGTCYGTISFTGRAPRKRPFTRTDKAIIQQFADWIGNEIARQQDHQALMDAKLRLERLASVDDLTNIANRRAFMDRANTELARYRRTGRTFSIVLLDIDRFKAINDTYGHTIGDAVLKNFANIIGKELRAVDVFGRIGGEEFCIVLDNTGPDDALLVSERLRAAIENHCKLDEIEETVTCSMGIATVTPHDANDLPGVIHRADVALYEAKRTGRNRCCVYHASMAQSDVSNQTQDSFM